MLVVHMLKGKAISWQEGMRVRQMAEQKSLTFSPFQPICGALDKKVLGLASLSLSLFPSLSLVFVCFGCFSFLF